MIQMKKKIESGVQEFFVYSICLFQIFRAFHFILHFHNKLKTNCEVKRTAPRAQRLDCIEAQIW